MTTIDTFEHRGKIWKQVTYDMGNPADIAKNLVRFPYTFPGGYLRVAITDDCGVLCPDCCRSEFRRIIDSIPGDGWHLEGTYTNYEDENLYCDHCGKRLPAAYED